MSSLNLVYIGASVRNIASSDSLETGGRLQLKQWKDPGDYIDDIAQIGPSGAKWLLWRCEPALKGQAKIPKAKIPKPWRLLLEQWKNPGNGIEDLGVDRLLAKRLLRKCKRTLVPDSARLLLKQRQNARKHVHNFNQVTRLGTKLLQRLLSKCAHGWSHTGLLHKWEDSNHRVYDFAQVYTLRELLSIW